MSAAPPGVDGAMMRTGRVGQSAAHVASLEPQMTATASAAARRLTTRRLMACSCGSMMRALRRARKRGQYDGGRSVAGAPDFRLGTGADVSPHRRWSEIAHGRGLADGRR